MSRRGRASRLSRVVLVIGSIAGFALLSVGAASAADGDGSSTPVNGYVRSAQSYAEPGDTVNIIGARSSCKYSDFLSEPSPGNYLWDWVQANLTGPDGELDPDLFADLGREWGGPNNCIQLVWRPVPILGSCDPTTTHSFIGDPILIDVPSGTAIYLLGSADGFSPLRCIVVDPPSGNPAFDVVDNHPVTAPAVDVNPYIRGAVGLDTWSWYDTPAPAFAYRSAYLDEFAVEIPTYIDAIPVTGDLWLQTIRWDFDGDGVWDRITDCSYAGAHAPPVTFAACAGTEMHPVVTDYIYEYRGLHDITVELQWTGYYDDPAGMRNYFLDTSPLVASTTRSFDVIEIRSELML